MKVREVLAGLDELSPPGTAEEWDNVGLLAGDPEWKTPGAIVSIDLTAEAIAEAVKKKYRLILNHHPCIFPRSRGFSRLTATGKSALVFEALRQGIAVAAYHTNFDRCALEVVRAVSHGLGVEAQGRLLDQRSGSLVKLSVFVPATHAEKVREALGAAGAGHIGNYDRCTFSSAGTGTFRGSASSRPFLGKAGRLETAEEIRVETVFPRGLEKPILNALLKAHPYEEVAYDLYPIEQHPSSIGLVRGLGYGFWGDLKRPMPFSAVAKNAKAIFNVDGFWLTEPASSRRQIKRIAFVAGKGASFVDAASALGCDLFITGETGYHTALDGSRRGMAVMELGHRESERFFLTTMEGWLSQAGLKSKAIRQSAQKFWTS